jgi:hypothetical protein
MTLLFRLNSGFPPQYRRTVAPLEPPTIRKLWTFNDLQQSNQICGSASVTLLQTQWHQRTTGTVGCVTKSDNTFGVEMPSQSL